MKFTVKLLSAAIALTSSTCAYAQQESMFSFSGFGTLGVVHSTEDQADFTPDIQTNEGVGASHSTSARPDSRIAGQVNANFTDKFTVCCKSPASTPSAPRIRQRSPWPM